MQDTWWLDLYRTRDPTDFRQLLLRRAHGHRKLIVRANNLGAVLPGWTQVTELHLRGYRKFIDHWLQGRLTREDWERALQWVRGNTGVRNPFEWLLAKQAGKPPNLERLLIRLAKKNLDLPFAHCYRQVLTLIMLERERMLPFRPRYCTGCGQLFLPKRLGQSWCGAPCRYRELQRRYRARKRDERRGGGRRSGPASKRSR